VRSGTEEYGCRWTRFRRAGARLLFASLIAGISGCSADAPSDRSTWKGLNAAEQSVKEAKSDSPARSGAALGNRPAALVGNETVTWNELSVPLAEASGAAVLEEICLDRLVSRELQNVGLTLEPGAIQREEDLLRETLTLTAGVPAVQQGDVLQQLRRTRGLGENRYSSLLRRNAMLRRLVRDDVKVTPEDVQQAFEIRYGQKFQTRLILVTTERDAAAAAASLRNGELFADVATRLSTDQSRLRGGLIGSISPADPNYPLALRKAIAGTPVGTPSEVIALEQGYAIILVEQVIPPTAADFGSVSSQLEHEVRLVRERAAMDRLAAQLLRTTTITVLDPALDWSWKSRAQ
jgi:hypothetical protein